MTNKEIAEHLYVSVTTVNFHVRNILAKLRLSSRRELRSSRALGPGQPRRPPPARGTRRPGRAGDRRPRQELTVFRPAGLVRRRSRR